MKNKISLTPLDFINSVSVPISFSVAMPVNVAFFYFNIINK